MEIYIVPELNSNKQLERDFQRELLLRISSKNDGVNPKHQPLFIIFRPQGRPKDEFEHVVQQFTAKHTGHCKDMFLIVAFKNSRKTSSFLEDIEHNFKSVETITLSEGSLDVRSSKDSLDRLASILADGYAFQKRIPSTQTLAKSPKTLFVPEQATNEVIEECGGSVSSDVDTIQANEFKEEIESGENNGATDRENMKELNKEELLDKPPTNDMIPTPSSFKEEDKHDTESKGKIEKEEPISNTEEISASATLYQKRVENGKRDLDPVPPPLDDNKSSGTQEAKVKVEGSDAKLETLNNEHMPRGQQMEAPSKTCEAKSEHAIKKSFTVDQHRRKGKLPSHFELKGNEDDSTSCFETDALRKSVEDEVLVKRIEKTLKLKSDTLLPLVIMLWEELECNEEMKSGSGAAPVLPPEAVEDIEKKFELQSGMLKEIITYLQEPAKIKKKGQLQGCHLC